MTTLDNRSPLARWADDLRLGVRLAVGGGRTSWTRLALTAVGVGLGVMVLLAATSVPHMLAARGDRGDARGLVPSAFDIGPQAASPQAVPGVDPVLISRRSDEFMGQGLQGYLTQPTGPAAPHAPGVARLPGPGEAVLSPGLRDLLNSPEGELLRPRFTQHIIGTIADEGLTGPNELFFYVGLDNLAAQPNVTQAYRFGFSYSGRELGGLEWLLVILGSASFLIPVVVFVATSTRLAASTRDRRLAALRLVGADGKQVRRIASGEAFVGALVGLGLGAALFLVARQLVPLLSFTALRGGIFTTDIRPEWTLIALIALAVPLVAVGVAVLSLRRTIIEPLGVVRRAKQSRRKLWWRLLPVVAGVGLLATQSGKFSGASGESGQTAVIAAVVLLLAAVPILLPWLVERVVWWLPGGSPAWQLAVRRLQLDSGTSARVVGGVAVVLTGAIALQSLFIPAQSAVPSRPLEIQANIAAASRADTARFAEIMRATPGNDPAALSVYTSLQNADNRYVSMTVGSCAELQRRATLPGCADGDVFFAKPASTPPDEANSFVPTAGQQVWFGSRGIPTTPGKRPEWTIPSGITTVAYRADRPSDYTQLLVTQAALDNAGDVALYAHATVWTMNRDPRFLEQIRNSMVPLGWSTNVYTFGTGGADATALLIRRILNIGSVITLLLAAASLMVVALEQMRERRRTLAVLMATGVPRRLLARSLLWQMAIPIVLAVAIAVVSGLALAALLLAVVAGKPVTFDWPTVAVYSATGLAAVFLVTGLTLPTLWQATGAEGLRGE